MGRKVVGLRKILKVGRVCAKKLLLKEGGLQKILDFDEFRPIPSSDIK